MLNLVDEALDQMALSVQVTVMLALLIATRRRGNDRLSATLNHHIKELSRIAGLVGNNIVSAETVDEQGGLCNVMALTCRQAETQRITQAIDVDMKLGAEVAPTAS